MGSRWGSLGRLAVAGAWFALLGCRHPSDGGGGEDGSSGSDPSSSSTDDIEVGETTADDPARNDGSELPVVPGDGAFGVGERLAAVVERSAGGNVRLRHWYDRELGLECEFVRAADGRLRCLPLVVPGATAQFAGDTCSEGVLAVAPCSTPPQYVRTTLPGAADCAEGPRQLTYRRGAPRSAPETMSVFDAFAGRCMPAHDASTTSYYELDRVADDLFVGAAIVEEDFEGSPSVRAIVADDGSYERHSLRDPATGVRCTPTATQADDGAVETRCSVDTWPVVGTRYGGPTCNSMLLSTPDDGTCETPALLEDGDGAWWTVDARHDDAVYYADGGSCYEAPMDAYDVVGFFDRGVPTDPPVALPVERVAIAGAFADDRLQPLGYDLGGGRAFELTGVTAPDGARWVDTVLGQPCVPVRSKAGGYACVGAAMWPHSPQGKRWGDPECNAIELVAQPMPSPSIVGFYEFEGGCEAMIGEARQVVGPWRGPLHRVDPGSGACVVDDDPPAEYAQLGEPIWLLDLPRIDVDTVD